MNNRQNNFAKRSFFNSSITKSQQIRKKKKDIQSIKNGNFVEPDPKNVILETKDEQVDDLEVVEDE